jgi:hypothetical protein
MCARVCSIVCLLKCSLVPAADKNVLQTKRFGEHEHFTYNLLCVCQVLRLMLQDTSLQLTAAVPHEKRSAAFTAYPLTDVAMLHVCMHACIHVYVCMHACMFVCMYVCAD